MVTGMKSSSPKEPVGAIKRVTKITVAGLRISKDFVDALLPEHSKRPPTGLQRSTKE